MKHIVNEYPLIIAESTIQKDAGGKPFHCVQSVIAYLTEHNSTTNEMIIRAMSLSAVNFSAMADKIAMIKYEYIPDGTPTTVDLPF